MALPQTDILRIEQLVLVMFDAALSANYLEVLLDFNGRTGGDLLALARMLEQTSLFESLYGRGPDAGAAFGSALLEQLGLGESMAAKDFITLRVGAGCSPAQLACEALAALVAYDARDQALLDAQATLSNRLAVSDHAAATRHLLEYDLGALRSLVAPVSADPDSVTGMRLAIDLAAERFDHSLGSGSFTPSIDNLVGTAGNDLFYGTVTLANNAWAFDKSTFQRLDQALGGSGWDVLDLRVSGASLTPVVLRPAMLAGMEMVRIHNSATEAVTLGMAQPDVSGFVSWGSIGKLGVTNLAPGGAIGVVAGETGGGPVDFSYASGARTATVLVSGGTASQVLVTNMDASSSIEQAMLVSAGDVPNVVGPIDFDGNEVPYEVRSLAVVAAAGLQATLSPDDYSPHAALKVVGVGDVTVDGGAQFETIDASGLRGGGLAVALGTDTRSFAGGQLNDTVSTNDLAPLPAGAVDAGPGDADRLVVRATEDVDTAAKAGVYSNFEVLDARDVTVDEILFPSSFRDPLASLRTAGHSEVTVRDPVPVSVYADCALKLHVLDSGGPADLVAFRAAYDSPVLEAAEADHQLDFLPTLPGIEIVSLQLGLDAISTDFRIASLHGLGALTQMVLAPGSAAHAITIDAGPTFLSLGASFDFGSAAAPVTFNFAAAAAPGLTLISGGGDDLVFGTQGSDTIQTGAGNDRIFAGVQQAGGTNEARAGPGGDTIVFSQGENTRMHFEPGDSVSATYTPAGFALASTDTVDLTGVDAVRFAEGSTGARFTLQTTVAAAALTYSHAQVVFGTTAVPHVGDFYVYADAAQVFVYQDTNRDGLLDAGEFAIRIIGDSGASAADNFAMADGALTYSSG